MKHSLNYLAAALIGAAALTTGPVAHAQQAAATALNAALTDGEIKKVDKDGGKVTIKHGDIKNLGMPGMTMVFRVQDPAMLDKVRDGDKVRFTAEKVNGALMVTTIEQAK
ncbi:copper-binding protein [Massilia sp. YMA4]|uniref:Copper-binding protein n=1 Tax=[Empedobacter] haloabium TaxID=592317 RepID=A0ABZ1URQ2_9BURK|nr:copper-binding protein [Massilia sp. YMA4]AXA91363.1 RND transporter [Massilia sp. YMA4]